MGLSIAKANSKTRIATGRRRGAKARGIKALCEALEERQLMSLTIEVRDASGGTSTTVNTVGQVVSLKVMAVITDSANDPSLDGVQDVSGDFLSTAQYGHAIAGNLLAANIAPFKASGASPGTQQDLNGDGNLDVGIDYATAPSTAGLFFARSNPIQTGGSSTGTISGNSLIFEIGTLTYTVTNLNKGGQTTINFSPYIPPNGQPDAAGWVENGEEKDNTNGTFQAGTPYVVSDPALVVAPVANPFSATVTKNTATTINELSVDDIVVPLSDASVTIITAVTHGVTALQPNGEILYTPNNGYLGADSFTYTVADTDGRVSNQATVSINVVPAPPPVANPQSANTIENQAVTINVLTGDSATAPATIVPSTVAVLTGPSHGTAVAQTDGAVIYTPTTGFTGTDTFTYTVADTNAETSAAGTVTVTVAAPVPPSVPANTPESTTAGAPLIIDLTTITTVGNSPLALGSIVIVTPPTEGTATPQTGDILYTPTPGFTGTDSFTYTIADTLGNVSNTGTISMTVTHGVPPTAGAVTTTALANQANIINVLSSDSSQAPLVPSSVTIVTQPTNGQATVNTSTGAITYTPLAGYIGTDSFTYTVGNTNLDTSTPALVSIDVGTSISNAKGVAHTLTFTDAAGGAEILSLNKGTAEIFFSGNGSVTTTGTKSTVTGTSLNIDSMILTGTTKASTLVVKGSVKTPATVGAITDSSPLGGINAPSLSIVEEDAGGVTNGQSIDLNSVGTLVLGSVDSAVITIGTGAPGKTALTFGVVSQTTLTSAVPITSLKAVSWGIDEGAGEDITAPSIGTLAIGGAFQPDLNLASTGKVPAISSAKIGGALAGNWNVSGTINTVTANSVGDGWTGSLTGASVKSFTIKSGGLASNFSAGAIGSLTIVGDVTGNISGSSSKMIKITGALTNSTLSIDGAAGQIIVGGAVTNSSIIASQSITALSAASITGSNVQAGTAFSTTGGAADFNFNQINATDIGSGKIGVIKTGAFAGTLVDAAKITTASLGTVTTANNGSTFGIATTSLGTFAGVFASTAIHAPHSVLTNEEVLQAYLQTQGAQLGDSSIALLS